MQQLMLYTCSVKLGSSSKSFQKKYIGYVAVFSFLLMVSTFILGCGKVPPQGAAATTHLWDYKKNHPNMYSLKDEVKIGEQVMEQQLKIFRHEKVVVNPGSHAALKQRLDRVVAKLAVQSDHPNFPYEVYLFDKPKIINAYSLPGGKFGVFTGLFDPTKGLINPNDENEIAAVMAHEMAHATLRHVTRRVTAMNAWGFLGSLASVALGQGVGNQAAGIFNEVFSFGTTLYLPSYSRKFEKQADQVGLYYMAKAGYDPNAAIRVWQRAAERKKGDGNRTHFFSSHPANGERARYLQQWLLDAERVKKGEIR